MHTGRNDSYNQWIAEQERPPVRAQSIYTHPPPGGHKRKTSNEHAQFHMNKTD